MNDNKPAAQSVGGGLCLSMNGILDFADRVTFPLVSLMWGMYLCIPLHKFQHIRVGFFGYQVPVYYFATTLPVALLGLAALARKRDWSRWDYLWWLIPIACLPGVVMSGDPGWSARELFSLVIRGIAPGALVFLFARGPDKTLKMLRFVLLVVLGVALYNLVELYFNRNWLWDNSMYDPIPETGQPQNPFYRPTHSHYSTSVSARPRGIQGNRIPNSACLVPFLPLILWRIRYEKRFRFVGAISGAVVFLAALLSESRTAWVGLALACLSFVLLGEQKNEKRFGYVAIAVVLLAISLGIPASRNLLVQRVASLTWGDEGIHSRLEMLKTASALKGHLIAGIGYGQYPIICQPLYRGSMPWVGTPDNQYLRWLIENGLAGLAGFLLSLGSMLYWGTKKIRAIPDESLRNYYASILSGWIGILGMFLFFDGFYWGACNMTFWILLGLFAGCLKSERAEKRC